MGNNNCHSLALVEHKVVGGETGVNKYPVRSDALERNNSILAKKAEI